MAIRSTKIILPPIYKIQSVLILLIITCYDVILPVHTYCQFNDGIKRAHQQLIEDFMTTPTVTDLKPFNYPQAATESGLNTSDYDYGFSYNYRDTAPDVDIKTAGMSYYYLGPSPSMIIVIVGSRHFHFRAPGSSETARANRILWREMDSQQFNASATDLVLEDYSHYIAKTIRLSDEADQKSLLFLVEDPLDKSLYISFTQDAGKTFTRRRLPMYIWEKVKVYSSTYRRSDLIQPSPSSMQRLLSLNMYVSINGGDTWREIFSREYFPAYQEKPHKAIWINDTTILASTYASWGISLHRCDVVKHACEMLLHDIKNFVVRGNVIVASIYHDMDRQDNRSLYTSTDLGTIWHRAQVASFQQHHKPYVYLMSESLSFLTLLNEQEVCYDLYVSDSQHVSYSLSMKCLYQERGIGGRVGVERLGNLPSAFVVNKMDPGADNPAMYVSLNNGGTWKLANVSNDTCSTCLSRVRPGSNSNDPATFDYWSETTVHDYEDSSGDNSRDSFYHVGTMLSSDFVPGFALSYIEQMKQHRAFPFATLDGGKSFFPIPVRNSQHFAFLNSGDVLVDYGGGRMTSFSLSFDRGHCWYNYSLFSENTGPQQSERLVLATNALNSKHNSVELLEFVGLNDYVTIGQNSWKAVIPVRKLRVKSYIINMRQLAEKVSTCTDDSTHIETDRECVLGKSYTFKRPKEGAETCRLHDTETEPKHDSCVCDVADFECDFGFERDESVQDGLVCNPFKSERMNLTSVCYHKLYEQHDKFFNTTGYRKVAGDSCHGGKQIYFSSKEVHSFQVLCTTEDYKTSRQEMRYGRPDNDGGSRFGTVFGILFLIVFILCCALAVIYLVKVKKYRLPAFQIPSFDSLRSNFSFSKFQNEIV